MTLEGEPKANRGWVGKLVLTKRQRYLAQQSINAAKFAYNWLRRTHLDQYKNWIDNYRDPKRQELIDAGYNGEKLDEELKKFTKENFSKYVMTTGKLSTFFTAERRNNPEKYAWLKEVHSYTYSDVEHTQYSKAYQKFLDDNKSGEAVKRIKEKKAKNPSKTFEYPKDFGFPRYKLKGDSCPLRINDMRHLDYEHNCIKLPGIGWSKVVVNQPLPVFTYPSNGPANVKLLTDGLDYYVSLNYFEENKPLQKARTDIMGIYFSMDPIAATDRGNEYFNIADDKRVKWFNRKIAETQKEIDKLRDGKSHLFRNINRKDRYKISSNKIKRLELRVKKLYIRLANYKKNHVGEQIATILTENPKGIVIKEENIKKLFKNKRYSKKLQQTGMATFRTKLVNAARKRCIEVRKSDDKVRYVCNSCGTFVDFVNGKRIITCPDCGAVINKGINEAKNLKECWANAVVV